MNLPGDRRVRRLLLSLLWLGAALYALHYLPRGWIAHDEGTIGQGAERVLLGELPHRDFDEPYTGGLTYLNALAMRTFGMHLMAPRLMLFLVFVAWIPALWAIARRVAPEPLALLFVALAISWSIPAYATALPSWYNTFLATFGVAACFRWIEAPRARWLLVAGVCGGLSILAKIVGLYYVAAVLLFLAYHEQRQSRVVAGADDEAARPRLAVAPMGIFLVALLAAFVVLATLTVDGLRRPENTITWVLPIAAVVALLVREELVHRHAAMGGRLRVLLRTGVPFVAGVALPLLLFLVPFVAGGGMHALVQDVFVRPHLRAAFASMAVDPPLRLLLAIPLLGVALVPARWWRARNWALLVVAAVALAAALAVSRGNVGYRLSWRTLVALLPVFTIGGAIVTMRDDADAGASVRRVLLLAAATTCALVQYPFAGKIYYLYAAPLFALAWLATLGSWRRVVRPGSALLAGFFLAFSVWAIHPAYIWNMGRRFWVDGQRTTLDLPRGRITVSPAASQVYSTVARFVAEKAHGGYVFAAPDCPEINFLSGTRNPTRVFFDFLDDTTGRAARIRAAIEAHDVDVAVINLEPSFSNPLPQELIPYFNRRFPHWQHMGKFLVFWREPGERT